MTIEEKTAKLTQFIVDNKLNFDDTGSGLNSAACILCGYALYLDDEEGDLDSSDVINAIDKSFIKIPVTRDNYVNEINRIFGFAYINNYGTWWALEDAKKQYKF